MVTNIIVSAVLVLIIGGAVAYVIKSKKSGAACIGCPHSKQCGGKCNCNSTQADKEN